MGILFVLRITKEPIFKFRHFQKCKGDTVKKKIVFERASPLTTGWHEVDSN